MKAFKAELDARQTGEVDVFVAVAAPSNNSANGSPDAGDGWVVIDGTGKSCAGIIAALGDQTRRDANSFIEVVIPDVLNTYDVLVWAEKGNHSVLTQRRDPNDSARILIRLLRGATALPSDDHEPPDLA